MNKPTHLEVANDHGHYAVKTGQLVKVLRETAAFFFVECFYENGKHIEMKVSKKTKLGLPTARRHPTDPLFNF